MSWAAVVVGVAAVAAAGISAYSAAEQADARKKQFDYQAKVAENNAKIAAKQRSISLQQGKIDAENAMLQKANFMSKQKAVLASNGLDLNSGSAIDLLATTEFLGQQDVNAIQNNAARQAWGYSVNESNIRAEGNLKRWQSARENPGKAAAIAGVSSLLSSASSYASTKL